MSHFTESIVTRTKRGIPFPENPSSLFKMVAVGSVFSRVKAILNMNFFVLVSWIAVIGVVFKFLRKEYVLLLRPD